jgi:hypothetical protein
MIDNTPDEVQMSFILLFSIMIVINIVILFKKIKYEKSYVPLQNNPPESKITESKYCTNTTEDIPKINLTGDSGNCYRIDSNGSLNKNRLSLGYKTLEEALLHASDILSNGPMYQERIRVEELKHLGMLRQEDKCE